MTETPITISFKKWIVVSAVIGYMALAIYLLFFVGSINLFSVIEKVNLGIYALAILTILFSVVFHTLVWFELLNYLGIKLVFRRVFVLNWVGIFVDNLIPGGWAGDLFKAYLLGREPSMEGGKVVASIVAKNMYEAIFSLGNIILGIILVVLNYSFAGSILIVVGGLLLVLSLPLIVLVGISLKPKSGKKAVSFFIRAISRLGRKRWNLQKFEKEIDKLLDDYHKGMVILIQKPRVLVKPVIYSFGAWILEILTLFLVFGSLGTFVQLDKVIIVRSIAGNVEAQGYVFAGYAQIINTTLYDQLGIQLALAASVGLLGGVLIFWLKTAISYAAFHYVTFSGYSKRFAGNQPFRISTPMNKIQCLMKFCRRNFKSISNKLLPKRVGKDNWNENWHNDKEHGSLEFHASKRSTN